MSQVDGMDSVALEPVTLEGSPIRLGRRERGFS
jgi:hypothetical protein